MNEYRLRTALQNLHHVIIGNLRLTLHDDLITLNGNHLTGILVNEVLIPTLQHTGSQFRTDILLQCSLVDLHLFRQVEDLEDFLICLKTYGTKQRRNRQLLLTVDVCIHHIIDVSGKLDP